MGLEWSIMTVDPASSTNGLGDSIFRQGERAITEDQLTLLRPSIRGVSKRERAFILRFD